MALLITSTATGVVRRVPHDMGGMSVGSVSVGVPAKAPYIHQSSGEGALSML